MQLFVLRRTGSALILAMVTLAILCGTVVSFNQYLNRQRIINNQLIDRFLAETLVEMTKGRQARFNYGNVYQVSDYEWNVILNDGKHIQVTQ